jgi:hypothetical protein
LEPDTLLKDRDEIQQIPLDTRGHARRIPYFVDVTSDDCSLMSAAMNERQISVFVEQPLAGCQED